MNWPAAWAARRPADENGCLLVRESDAPHFGTRSGEIGILAYKAEALARQKEAGGPDALTAVSEAKAGQGSGNYLPQALGIGWPAMPVLTFTRCCVRHGPST